MKNIFLLLLVLLLSTKTEAQKHIELINAYNQFRYDDALRLSKETIEKTPLDPFPYTISGWIYLREKKYDSVMAPLSKVIQLDNDSTTLSVWAHYSLGVANVNLGNKTKGIEELKRCIEIGTNAEAANKSEHILDSLGYKLPEKEYPANYLPNWIVIQGTNITYKFQDTTGMTSAVWKFIANSERDYLQLNEIFHASLPSKMVLHVWCDADIAEKILHREPGFVYWKQCFAHIKRTETSGYLIAGTLAYWSGGKENTGYSSFISKGVGRAFDLQDYDKLAEGRRFMSKNKITDVLDVWENEKAKKCNNMSYPIAGAFITYLFQNTSRDKFLQAIKVQTIEGVKTVYGDQFDKIITDFNHLMGMR